MQHSRKPLRKGPSSHQEGEQQAQTSFSSGLPNPYGAESDLSELDDASLFEDASAALSEDRAGSYGERYFPERDPSEHCAGERSNERSGEQYADAQYPPAQPPVRTPGLPRPAPRRYQPSPTQASGLSPGAQAAQAARSARSKANLRRHAAPPVGHPTASAQSTRSVQLPAPAHHRQAPTASSIRPPRRRYVPEEDYDFVPTFEAREKYIPRRYDYRFWFLGGVLLVGLTILVEPTRVISSMVKTQDYDCQEVLQPRSVLSREQLTQLLAIPERSSKDKVRAVMEEPYCLMPSVTIRAGIPTVREAYPLEFDPEMWIVMLYEGDEYAGYRFNAR